jgi:chemotaxis signal transduction protein
MDAGRATRHAAAGAVEAEVVGAAAPDEVDDHGLAQRSEAVVARSGAVRACLFGLDEEVFAVDVCHARPFVRLEEWTPVPGAPSSLIGVVNLGGAIVPVVDIRPLLALRPGGMGAGTHALVVAAPPYQVAIVIDRPLGLGFLDEDTLAGEEAPSPSFGRGYVPWEGRRALVLDVPRILEALRMGFQRSDEGEGK